MEQDDYTYPRCNTCQKWGHGAQKCPSKRIFCAFCAQEHHSSACPKIAKQCANGGSTGHCAIAKTCASFKDCIKWAGDNSKKIIQRSKIAQAARLTVLASMTANPGSAGVSPSN
ncbi:hypothetical protein ACOME3_009389 [Neoechinorhynchus agilis]